MPSSRSMRATSWVARSEWPPSAKKSSPRDTVSTPRIAVQIPASAASVSVAGAAPTLCPGGMPSTAGRALRSSLPLADRGRAGLITQRAGTIGAGSRVCSQAASRPAKPAASAGITLGSTWATSVASISPGSTRKPRIFTWSSARPR